MTSVAFVAGKMTQCKQQNPDFDGGANKMSLNEARKAWKEGMQIY